MNRHSICTWYVVTFEWDLILHIKAATNRSIRMYREIYLTAKKGPDITVCAFLVPQMVTCSDVDFDLDDGGYHQFLFNREEKDALRLLYN